VMAIFRAIGKSYLKSIEIGRNQKNLTV